MTKNLGTIEFAVAADALKEERNARCDAEAKAFRKAQTEYAEALEAIQFDYWDEINALIAMMNPLVRRKARRYANGDSTVYRHRRKKE